MTWYILLICLLIVSIILIIVLPAKNYFLSKDIYPELKKLNQINSLIIKNELMEIKDSEYKEYPDQDMWKYNSSSKFFIYPLFMIDKLYNANIEKCKNTFKILKSIPNVIHISICRLESHSVLKVHQNWKELANYSYRCIYGINSSANDISICGVLVEGELKK